jgi:hypothetical protein
MPLDLFFVWCWHALTMEWYIKKKDALYKTPTCSFGSSFKFSLQRPLSFLRDFPQLIQRISKVTFQR